MTRQSIEINSNSKRGLSRTWLSAIIATLIIVTAAILVILQPQDIKDSSVTAAELNLIEVRLGDLIQQETLDGTLGSVQYEPIKTRIGGTITDAPSPGDVIKSGEALYSVDGNPVILLNGLVPAFRDLTISEQVVSVSSRSPGTITWLPDHDAILQSGEIIYKVDEQPSVLLYGDIPAYRTLEQAATSSTTTAAMEALIDAESTLAVTIEEQMESIVDAESTLTDTIEEQTEFLIEVESVLADTRALSNELISESDEQLEAAQQEYSDRLIGWFGNVIPEESFGLSPTELVSSWGTTIDKIFEDSRRQVDSPLDDATTPWNDSVVWVWTHLTPFPVLTECEDTSSNYGRCPAAEISEAWDSKIAAYESHTELVAEQQELIDNATADVTKTRNTHAEVLADLKKDSADLQQAYDEAVGDLKSDIADLQQVYDEAVADLIGDDVLQLQKALIDLGFGQGDTLDAAGLFGPETESAVKSFQAATGLEVDGNLDESEIIFLPGPAQVVELTTSVGAQANGGGVLRVATGHPTTGIDVLQLENALVDLGFTADGAVQVDGIYTLDTAIAVRDFQATVGMEPDGILNLGEMVFVPDEVRVTDQIASEGSAVVSGSQIIGISLSSKVVRVDLPASNQGLLVAGDRVTVELPDSTEVPATVQSVAQTATVAQLESATFDVVVELDDPSYAESWDEAPVDVIVVSDFVEDATVVPVSALLALLEGGFAVEKYTGVSEPTLIAVDPGFYGDDGWIQVASTHLRPGDTVIVP